MARKWIESLLDDMVESQWSNDIIEQEYERFLKLTQIEEMSSVEELEPINRFSTSEIEDGEVVKEDFNAQIENFSKSDYQNHLISKAVDTICGHDYFDIDDEYVDELIRQHLQEEKDFFDMVVKEAIAEEYYFQEYIEKRIAERYDSDYPIHDEDLYFVEYPIEKEVFEDLGDTSYMDQGIFEGANTDVFEEPFNYSYYENSHFDDDFDMSAEFIDIENAPEVIEEPKEENMDDLIEEKLFEEKYLDKVFVEIIKKEEYFDKIICEKLANDVKLNEKIDKLP